jgi:hypothetical protein
MALLHHTFQRIGWTINILFWSRSRRTRCIVEQGDVLESIEIIRVGEEAASGMHIEALSLKGAKQT